MLWTRDSSVTRGGRERVLREVVAVLSTPESTCEDGEAVHSSTVEIAQ